MPDGYFHGVRHTFIDDDDRPITTQSDESIYLVADAPEADDDIFPVGETTLIFGGHDTDKIAALGAAGGAPRYLNGIFDQVNARVFLHRLPDGADEAARISDIIGDIDVATGRRTGLQAAFDVKQRFGIDPSIFIAPGFSHHEAVATEMAVVAKKLLAVFVIDGPNGEIDDAIIYRGVFDEPHGMMIDPYLKVRDTQTDQDVAEPPSARIAGIVAATPWWESASSRTIRGTIGPVKDIDYRGDGTSRAELMNQNHISTVVLHPNGGRKLLGGRSLGADQKFAFFKRMRVMNVFARTIIDQQQYAVDKNITRRYFEIVTESMNKWIRRQVALEHIAGGNCWVRPDLNTPQAQEAGEAIFDYDFVEFGEAERVTFRAHINNGYLVSVVPV